MKWRFQNRKDPEEGLRWEGLKVREAGKDGWCGGGPGGKER